MFAALAFHLRWVTQKEDDGLVTRSRCHNSPTQSPARIQEWVSY